VESLAEQTTLYGKNVW